MSEENTQTNDEQPAYKGLDCCKLLCKEDIDLEKTYKARFHCDSYKGWCSMFEESTTCGSDLEFDIEGESLEINDNGRLHPCLEYTCPNCNNPLYGDWEIFA